MPEIARFFGIIIRNLHAYYQDDVGIFAIDTVELLAAWNRLQAGRPPGKIEPLR